MLKSYISKRGVYYDLNKSPYFYEDNKGNKFLFSSRKKYDMFVTRLKKKQEMFHKEIDNLIRMGYEINKSYRDNIEDLPARVYNEMIYK